jgi:hypothetical protein
MSKIYDEPIAVQMEAHNEPVKFIWRGRRYAIKECLATWRERHSWWRRRGEINRMFVRVETDRGGMYDLCFDISERRWRLYRVWD